MNPTDPTPPDAADENPDNPARTVIAAFGGIRPMAAKLGVPVTTVQGWKKRGVIPANRRDEIAAAAQTHDIAVSADLLAAAAPDDDERAAGAEDAAAPEADLAAATEVPAERAAEPLEPAADGSQPAEAPAPGDTGPVAAGGVAADKVADQPTSAPVADIGGGPPETAAPDPRPEPPPAPPPAAPPPVASGSGSGRGLAWLALILAVLAGAAVVTRGQWEPIVWGQAANDGLADRVAALETMASDDLEGIERLNRIEALASDTVSRQDAQADTLEALAGEVTALAGRIVALPAAADDEDIAALRDQVAALEQAIASGAAGDAGAAVALGERVAALDAAIADVAGQVSAQAADVEALAAVAGDLARLESGLAGLESGLADRIGGLEGDLAAVGAQAAAPSPEVLARLDRFEAELAAAAGVVQDLERALAGMAAVESRLAALETLGQATDTANVALRDSMTDIGRRLDRVNQDIAGLDGGLQALRDDVATARAGDVADQALLLALGQVRDAVASGAAYEPALSALAGLAPSGPETAGALEVLAQHAGTGVPTALELMRRFAPMAEQVRRAAAIPADGDWMDEALASVQGLVTIRRAPGEVAGDDADAVLARAEARLQAGDVAGAVAALESMDNPSAADAASQWLQAARGHLAVATAIQTVNGAVLARVAAAGSGTGQ